jgi:hypothetical protein
MCVSGYPIRKGRFAVLNTLDEDIILKPVVERANTYNRRLSDKILIAFHQACDERDLEVAKQLLKTLEVVVYSQKVPPERNRRKEVESLVGAHHRLWNLRNS